MCAASCAAFLWLTTPPHTQRVTRDIHGIKIVVIQTGQLGSYDTVGACGCVQCWGRARRVTHCLLWLEGSQTTLLLQLTTSLTLLAVATTLVDVLATRVLPSRTEYKSVKYDVRHPACVVARKTSGRSACGVACCRSSCMKATRCCLPAHRPAERASTARQADQGMCSLVSLAEMAGWSATAIRCGSDRVPRRARRPRGC